MAREKLELEPEGMNSNKWVWFGAYDLTASKLSAWPIEHPWPAEICPAMMTLLSDLRHPQCTGYLANFHVPLFVSITSPTCPKGWESLRNLVSKFIDASDWLRQPQRVFSRDAVLLTTNTSDRYGSTPPQ